MENIPNVLATRYASKSMKAVWSAEGRIALERDYWIAVLRAQKDLGLDIPQEAIDAPRAFSDAGSLKVENGYSNVVRQELADMGHDVVTPDTAIGGAQAIDIRLDGVLVGASDPRKDGCALGY